MPQFFTTFLRNLRGARSTDMRLLCRQLLSQRGEASQTVLARRIIEQYNASDPAARLRFFEMLAHDFGPDPLALQHAIELYQRDASPATMAALNAASEPPRQELLRRINTAPGGTEALVAMRTHMLRMFNAHPELATVDADFKHLFRSWFNRGFLRIERIGWHTAAITLEKLIEYESVHEINGWHDLRRRLESDRRCFAFFQPALPADPVVFVEVALTQGLAKNIEPLLDIHSPVLSPEKADTAIFYSINNCLDGLRGIPFANFLIKQVVEELGAELPRIRNYSTLSPVPNFARALKHRDDPNGFTPERLSRLLADFANDLKKESGKDDPVEAFTDLLKNPIAHQKALSAPLRRLALVYLTEFKSGHRPYDPVARFHFSNGARLEAIDPFANLRDYGLRDSFGLMVNYRYVLDELEENHERFVIEGATAVSPDLEREQRTASTLWHDTADKRKTKTDTKAVAVS